MIGQVLREARKNKSLTLKQVAETVDVTTGHISHLENNRMEPSIALLRKLSDVLDLPASLILRDQQQKVNVQVVRKSDRAKVQFSNLPSAAEFLTPLSWRAVDQPIFEVIQLEIPAGSELIKGRLKLERDEFVYLLDGVLEYHYANETITLAKGDSLYIPKNTGFTLCNATDRVASIIWLTRKQEA